MKQPCKEITCRNTKFYVPDDCNGCEDPCKLLWTTCPICGKTIKHFGDRPGVREISDYNFCCFKCFKERKHHVSM